MLGMLIEAVFEFIAELVFCTLPKRVQIGCLVVTAVGLTAMLVWAFGPY
jgi:hypothetical protein